MIFLQHFGSPQYYDEVDNLLNGYKQIGSSQLREQFKLNVRNGFVAVQNRAHYRGTVVLGLCVVYLIFIGFEPEDTSDSYLYAPLLYCTIFVDLVIIFSKYLLKSWRDVFSIVALYVILYIVLSLALPDRFGNNNVVPIFCFLYKYKEIILIATVLFPIMHQLYLNWLYSSIYKEYLANKVRVEYFKLTQSLDGIKNKVKSKVDKLYLDAWTDLQFASKDDYKVQSDVTVNKLYDVFYEQLLAIASPSRMALLKSWVKYHLDKLSKCTRHLKNMETGMETTSDSPLNLYLSNEVRNDVMDFSEEFNAYKKRKNHRLTLKKYCKSHGINYEYMSAWLRVNKGH